MTIELQYEPGDRVWIKEIEAAGWVTAVYIQKALIHYKVAYFANSERHEEYLFAEEIAKLEATP